MVIHESRGDRIFNVINNVLLGLIFLICFYPLFFIVIASISNPDLVNAGKVWLWPQEISLNGYKALLQDERILRGYLNTLLNLAVTLPAAYALSRKDFVGRKFFTLMFTFTMFFSGGLIPTFMVVKKLGLYDNPMVMIVLGATSMSNIIITRTFFQTNIPDELREAAELDGCSNTRFFFQIVLPLSGAIVAVMTLFFAVAHWNSYFVAMIYLRNDAYQPLQVVMREIFMRSQFTAQMLQQGGDAAGNLQEMLRTSEQIKYALIVVASLPVMALYPFVQKYFVKGVTMGSVKG